jgi:hypothetical protein
MVRQATPAELKAAREDERQLHLLPPVSPEETAAMRTVAAVAFDLVDHATASDATQDFAEFRRAYRMVMEMIERLERTP